MHDEEFRKFQKKLILHLIAIMSNVLTVNLHMNAVLRMSCHGKR